MNQISIILSVLAAGSVLAQEQHPRLFVTPERVKRIQEQAQVKDAHHPVALAALQARADNPDLAVAYGEAGGYVLYSVGSNGKDDGGKGCADRTNTGDYADWDDIGVRIGENVK